MSRSGKRTVNSRILGQHLGLTDAQVRRDLSIFGQFGQRGVGYPVSGLTQAIREILGTDRSWDVILVGLGNLGRALCGYRGFSQQSFRLVGVFDNDPKKVGTTISGQKVFSLSDLEKIIQEKSVQLAILAVPAEAAQEVADRLEKAGICGILNFAPINLRSATQNAAVVNVDMALELQRLAFAVVNATTNS